jgi:DNA modification methylase
MFPVMLIERLIRCFMNEYQEVVLDPFVGSGSTLVACQRLGKTGIGFEISEKFARLARRRLVNLMPQFPSEQQVITEDARRMAEFVPDESVDFCVTSPPYWDVLSRPRTADGKATRDYGNDPRDLGRIRGYQEFLENLAEVSGRVHSALKPGSYFVLNVMDLRKKDRFFPLHSDVVPRMCEKGFTLDDLIVWDRSSEYNNLRPLGYPSVFRMNKVHEYLLVFLKALA